MSKSEMRRRWIDVRDPDQKAPDIFKREMDDAYKNTKVFLQNLLSNIEITNTKVGQSFNYPRGIIENNIYLEYGIFMDYFIRKHLSNQYHTGLEDIATEVVLKKRDVYFNNPNIKRYIFDHYQIFQNPQTNAMNILESIKFVSHAYSAMYDQDKVFTIEIDSEDEMLLEIIRYFESLPFESVNLTPNLDCEYFRAVPDFIFNNGGEKVLYNIKTSKYETLLRNDANFSPANFYILIAYAFGYYKKTNESINTFIIYNPLLGYEHKIVLKNIDFEEFQRCLESDYVNKYGNNWRQNPPERW